MLNNPHGWRKLVNTPPQSFKLENADLRCLNSRYDGELVTPVGTYSMKTGTFEAGQLKLQLEAGTDSVSLSLKQDLQDLNGQFISGLDFGPLTLHRTGEARVPDSTRTSGGELSQQQWVEDMDFFARELPLRHANAFNHQTREQFDAAIADLKHRLLQMNRDQVYVSVDSIANAIGDGHTYVEFPPDMANLPVVLRKMSARVS